MTANKDTVKAIDAATTLIKYCNRYKLCNKCIFRTTTGIFRGCAINRPFSYLEIKEGEK